MSKSFFRLWLPISLGVHLVLFFVLKFVPIEAATPQEVTTKVSLVTIPDAVKPSKPKPKPVTPEIEAPKIETPRVKPTPMTPLKPGKVGRDGANHPSKADGVSRLAPGPVIAHKPIGPVGFGKGKKRTPAPHVATSPTGTREVPSVNTSNDGVGTGGNSHGELEGGGSGEGGTGETCAAQATYSPDPGYPKDALNEGVDGSVSILFSVDADGDVSVDVSRSSGVASLDKAALRMARRWRFSAKKVNGRGVATSETHTFYFKNGNVSHD